MKYQIKPNYINMIACTPFVVLIAMAVGFYVNGGLEGLKNFGLLILICGLISIPACVGGPIEG